MPEDSAPLGTIVIEHVESINWFPDGEMLVHLKGEPLRIVVIRMPALAQIAKAFRDWAPTIAQAIAEYEAAQRRN